MSYQRIPFGMQRTSDPPNCVGCGRVLWDHFAGVPECGPCEESREDKARAPKRLIPLPESPDAR